MQDNVYQFPLKYTALQKGCGYPWENGDTQSLV
jgi:hypothetical protein